MSDGKIPDLGQLMSMAQKLQGDVVKIQEELAKAHYEASSGGGMVTAVVNGQYELVSIQINGDVVDPSDMTMLQDLVVAAVNQALQKARAAAQTEMSKLTGGLGIPGLSGIL